MFLTEGKLKKLGILMKTYNKDEYERALVIIQRS
jgi:hypothetical protein